MEETIMTDDRKTDGLPGPGRDPGDKLETPLPAPRVQGLEVDVVIIGAGIAGLTAALTLKRAGRRVVVLEAKRSQSGESSRTTAHLTEVADTRFATLLKRFGVQNTQLFIEGQLHAIDQIERWSIELAPNCGFQRLRGFLFAAAGDRAQLQALEMEESAVRKLGYGDIRVAKIPAPFPVAGALRFDRQAQLRPSVYLAALESHVPGHGSLVVRGVRALSMGDDGADRPCRVVTNGGDIFCERVIIATHVPMGNHLPDQAKQAAYRSYAVAAPLGRELGALLWDLGSPYHHYRTVRMGDREFLVAGGGDHPVGESVDTEQVLADLVEHVRGLFGPLEITHRWSGQIIETEDGLPYAGEASTDPRVLFATGLSGNGFTNGTLAGLVLADAVRGRGNRWARLLAPRRPLRLASLGRKVRSNLTAVKRFATRIKDHTRRIEDLEPRCGMITSRHGGVEAIYRNEAGALIALSAICPNGGGQVEWNRAERSWDCPSCGSRFDVTGQVLNGPAENDLLARSLEEPNDAALAVSPASP